ncbi:uncharacterized protein LOC143276651 [Babylonia areolata]|uniref:uncharacterized protein LOC143276651 n=1 Tax=Babylonia areolata TaxID=304850 RepID=UPI003FD658AB
MCRWGCNSTNTTYTCKWCGTWFCKQCLRGAYWGVMSEPLKCRVCFQTKCQGVRVDFVERPRVTEEDNRGRKSAGDIRSGTTSASKSSKTAKNKSKAKSAGGMKKKKK